MAIPLGRTIMLKIKENIKIAQFSTFKIGGQARYFCEVENSDELLAVVHIAEKLKAPYKIVAAGSNVVFPDGILDCFLIRIKTPATEGHLKIIKNKIIVDAGVELMPVIKKAISHGLKGLETLSGIPGTIGGAIIGNAGAYGHSISEAVEKVEILSFDAAQDKGEKIWLKNKDCRFSYRHSIFKEKPFIVLQAVLKFKKGSPAELKKISQNIIKIRRKKYKPNLRCAGSFFKNVPIKGSSKKIPAGHLLEQVGAKKMRVGGIKVADFHANVLINNGKGKASEVKKLAQILKARVKKKFGIILEEEVRYF